MRILILLTLSLSIALTSCVSKKKYAYVTQAEADATLEATEAKEALIECEKSLAVAKARNESLQDQVNTLNNSNAALLNSVGDLATLSSQEAANLEKSLESIREKDLQIRTMQEAITKKDSVTLALVTSLKGVLGNMDDSDIQIEVEKGAVFVSISDKMLFKSGSTTVSKDAGVVLQKIATVLNSKPNIEFLVEGHTDNVPISSNCVKDNWDLSVLRATSVVRILQEDYNVDPTRMTAGGRSEYMPVATNDDAESKAKNRRTRIVILPKLDQFFEMIEEGMEEASEND